MASGDIVYYGPYQPHDTASMHSDMFGNVVAADTVRNWIFHGSLWFMVIKA